MSQAKTEKKVAEGKRSSRKAEKLAEKAKIKKAADAIITNMASDMPGAGQAKSFLQITRDLDKIEADIAALNLAKRGKRAALKEMKIELRVYDHVRKLRKMEPEDAKSFKATQALYEEQLLMPLSDDQKAQLEIINKKREEARIAMAAANGGDTGKEVGSGANEEPEEDHSGVPQINEAIGGSFRPPVSSGTH